MTKNAAILVALAVLALATAPLGALEYEVRLVNGNAIQTRYEPIEAPFDSTRLMFMTVNGNPMTIPKDRVATVVSLTDVSGFGKRLDAATILIGLAPNDNPTPEEQAAMEAEGGGVIEAPPSITNPLTTEPDATGGLPLQFLNLNTPPIGASGAGAGGSAADLRRTQGGTQFVEPQTRD